MSSRLRHAATMLSGTAMLALCAPALAQAPPIAIDDRADTNTDQTQTGSQTRLDEIVVTAEKRSASLQSVPLAISAVDEALIEARNITSADQLGAIAPNLTTTTGPNSTSHLIIHIRGIGESEPVLTNDSPVSIYIDGVVVGRSTGSVFDIVDLERIEVLRGPQGTLYGRNTTGGAVNFITRKPSREMGVRAMASYGNFEAVQARLSVDTGDIGESGLKATFSYFHKQRNGYVDDLNAPDKRDPGAYNGEAARAAVLFDKGGAFTGLYTFDWTESSSVSPASQLAVVNPDQLAYFSQSPAFGGTGLVGPSLERLDFIRSEGTFIDDTTQSHTLTLETELSDALTLRSITGFRKWDNDTLNTDLDGNAGLAGLVVSPGPPSVRPVSLFGADKFDRQHQWTQEINVLGQIGDRLDYVIGGFLFDEEASERNPQRFTVVRDIPDVGLVGINLENPLEYSTRNRSLAGFGQVTFELTDSLSIVGGARYTKDEKRLIQSGPANFVRDLQRSFDSFNYAGTVQFQATPDILVYGRVASGYKAGGFNPRSINDGYEPEEVTNYEAGIKSELFDRRLRLNLVGFYSKLDDKQLNQFVAGAGGASSITINAGSGTFKGVELEFDAVPFEGFRVNGSFGYTDRDFDTFLVFDPAVGEIVNVADEAQYSYSASTTGNVGAQYTVGEMLGGQLSARLDYLYRSKVNYNVVPRFSPNDAIIASPGVGLLDGRISLSAIPLGGVEAQISLWGKNLTDEEYRISGIDFGSLGFATNTYGVPRTYGVDLRIEY
ncbi:TonB-dependent receptor [Croceicoccus sp. F390]|uniref:TonB-dependent receptor n=1 Tax=Croceicoccus esteveae TaxID=3075597 RepID=A0ABU2ZFK3_9SPHN|nr:TonB-dependent receptor [Croceicoccus sp. F390]MDT0575379.1 TonB-dependent receptor [Croceicoccus sp. F390]